MFKLNNQLKCTICTKICNDFDEHIEHMKIVHNKKHHFRCSKCGLTFLNKSEIEQHVVEHKKIPVNNITTVNQQQNGLPNGIITPRTRSSANESSSQSSIQDVESINGQKSWSCKCGKNYYSVRSYEIHKKNCPYEIVIENGTAPEAPSSISLKRDSISESSTTSSALKSQDSSLLNNWMVKITREELAMAHQGDFKCKNCSRPLQTIVRISKHLCRRSNCRQWYVDNLYKLIGTPEDRQQQVKEQLEKRVQQRAMSPPNEQQRKSIDKTQLKASHLSAQVSQKRVIANQTFSPNQKRIRSSLDQLTDQSKSLNQIENPIKTNSAHTSLERNRMVKNKRRNRNNDSPNKPLRCPHCKMTFFGRKPRVALTNHLRGSTCTGQYTPVGQLITKLTNKKTNIKTYNPVTNKTSSSSIPSFNLLTEQLNKATPTSTTTQMPKLTPKSSERMKRSYTTPRQMKSEAKFYCRLCPKIRLQTRIALGCHLTITHGLPQVNVTTTKGDAFRCQTCRQLFSSKYFYNTHRGQCDKTSDYIGIIDTNNNSSQQQTVQLQTVTTTITTKKCDYCKQSGFKDDFRLQIHQKYHCKKKVQMHNKTLTNQRNSVGHRIPRIPIKDKNNLGPEGQRFMTETAKLNALAKTDASLTMCDGCGGGPYHSYYYFLQHKREFCPGFKKDKKANQSEDNSNEKAMPSLTRVIKDNLSSNKNGVRLSLEGSPVQKARKSTKTTIESPDKYEATSSFLFDDKTIQIDEIKPIECSICNNKYNDIQAFVHHRLTHLNQDLDQQNLIDPLNCEICHAKIEHYQRIQQHLVLHLQNLQISKKRKLIQVKRRNSRGDNSLQEIKLDEVELDSTIDESDLYCRYCGIENKSKEELIVHTKECQLQCENCDIKFASKESFAQHKEICQFSRQNQLGISNTDQFSDNFKCNNCNVEFKFKQQLHLHQHSCLKVYSLDFSGQIEVSDLFLVKKCILICF